MRDSANIPESRRPAMTASGRSEPLAYDWVRPGPAGHQYRR